MPWWLKNNLRMIQNNLRDIDAAMDIDAELAWWQEMGANTVQLGCGGITSFYPSALECQTPSPYLRGDAFGEWVEKCHAHGIRVIARFDFSKTHERLYEAHPEWYARSIQGGPVRYHDTVATCLNGAYQQECSIEILREALGRYPVDGVFFNMFGYQTRDYSGNYTGICQCGSCKRRFYEMTGHALPREENPDDPAFRAYLRFKTDTVAMILEKIHHAVKEINPEIAVSTYHHQHIDIVRSESNSAVDRPYPFWLYASAENVGLVEGSFEDKIASNVAINAVDLPYRFMGVSKHLNALRLYGNMAGGSGLDWCIIGSHQDYPDRDNFQMVKEVFQFHKRHEAYYGNLASQARILLVRPDRGLEGGLREFRGLYKMLKEEHLLFRAVEAFRLEAIADELDGFDAIVLPSVGGLSEGALTALVETRARVIATGLSFRGEDSALERLFGVKLGEKLDPVRGAYLQTSPKEVFRSFPHRDWVYLDMEFRRIECLPGTRGLLPLVGPARYGPPERCFGHAQDGAPGLTVLGGSRLYFPWMPGTLYYQHGYEDFKQILMDALASFAQVENPIVTNAPPQVEVFFDKCDEGKYLFQLLNLSGCNGVTIGKPLPIHGIETEFPGLHVKRVLELLPDGARECGGGNRVRADVLEVYKAYVLRE